MLWGRGRQGSSPRARGADSAADLSEADLGVIPACAGSSLNDLPL
ncbi:hypothetical protein SSAG_02611 [Streptomyces sp. Mg1]|nr:hypothetical protein SSAG_02611 [Streptomyces sp. Mg1]